jgi:hypothetical protein
MDKLLSIELAESTTFNPSDLAMGSLTLFGEPYWCADNGHMFEWQWFELLAHLERNWGRLYWEESYPIPVSKVAHPGCLLERADERWAEFSPSRRDEEEREIFSFWNAHNLSEAMPGADFPALIVMRSGKMGWIVNNTDQAKQVAFDELIESLETIGNTIAKHYANTNNVHLESMLLRWNERSPTKNKDIIKYRSGLCLGEVNLLSEPTRSLIDRLSKSSEDQPLLAAARMSHRWLNTVALDLLLEMVAGLDGSPAIDDSFHTLEQHILPVMSDIEAKAPYVQGSMLASFLREELGLGTDIYFDVEDFLIQHKVIINLFDFQSANIDAVALWGKVNPIIFINSFNNARTTSVPGRRATLAHELCHLLVDRLRALPVGEVLRGDVDQATESRANAFAAEMLVPQEYVMSLVSSGNSILAAIEMAHNHMKVGRPMIAWQILNSGRELNVADRKELNSITS